MKRKRKSNFDDELLHMTDLLDSSKRISNDEQTSHQKSLLKSVKENDEVFTF